jgi:hypothetical protein
VYPILISYGRTTSSPHILIASLGLSPAFGVEPLWSEARVPITSHHSQHWQDRGGAGTAWVISLALVTHQTSDISMGLESERGVFVQAIQAFSNRVNNHAVIVPCQELERLGLFPHFVSCNPIWAFQFAAFFGFRFSLCRSGSFLFLLTGLEGLVSREVQIRG